MTASRLLGIVAACALIGCTPQREPWGQFEPEAARVADGRDPTIHVSSSGKILLLAATGGAKRGVAVRASEDGGDSYGPARRLDGGGDVEAHGEGRPLLRVGARQEEYAIWSERDGEAKQLWLSRSLDYGHSYSKPLAVAVAGGAGFFDFAVAPSGRIALVWLSHAPASGARPGTASIEASVSDDRGGSWSAPVRVVTDVCPCCRPRLAATPDGGWLLTWRGVADENVRDPYVARGSERLDELEAPVRVSADGWKIDGCPHCGASLAIVGDRVWIAWSTGATGEMRGYVTSSSIAKLAFEERRQIGDGLRDVNHLELASSGDRLWVAFQARSADERASFAPMSAWVAPVASGRVGVALPAPRGRGSALYPMITPVGEDKLLLAWTDSSGEGTGIATARVRLGVR